jgi:hypothetical protein
MSTNKRTQKEMAETLTQELQSNFAEVSEVTALDILDLLACSGLSFKEGMQEASTAYFAELSK